RWQKAFRAGYATARASDPLRFHFKTICSLSVRDFGLGFGILVRWPMGGLRNHPRRRVVAQPSGWERPLTTYILAGISYAAVMVARWSTHRLPRSVSGKTS